MSGLLRYLLGPGRAEEHSNHRVIAAEAVIPVARGVPLSEEELHSLTFFMDLPRRLHDTRIIRNLKASDGSIIAQPAHVWHLSLSNPAGDRLLSDAEWVVIAEDLIDRLGFSVAPGRAAWRWVAVHRGLSPKSNDLIDIAVCLVREDDRAATIHNDWINVGRACSDYEASYGLTVVQGQRTRAPRHPGARP